jgi:hypothetical protein
VQGAAGEDAEDGGGSEPAAGERKAFLLRLSPEVYGELRAWAAQDLRSLNGHIEWLLREALRRREGRPRPPPSRG